MARGAPSARRDRALATALSPDDYNLRQFDSSRLAAVLNDGCDVLQLVHDREQMLQPAPNSPYKCRGHGSREQAPRAERSSR
jgi:hypothetical protein